MRRALAGGLLAFVLAGCGPGEVVEHHVAGQDVAIEVGHEFTVSLPLDGSAAHWGLDEIAAAKEFATSWRNLPAVGQVEVLYRGEDQDRRHADIDVELFLKLDVGDADRMDVQQRLESDERVASGGVTFVSQAQQLLDFREYFADQPEYLENVVATDLPESFRVRLRRPTTPYGIVHLVSSEDNDGTQIVRFEATAPGHHVVKLRRTRSTGATTRDATEQFDLTVTKPG